MKKLAIKRNQNGFGLGLVALVVFFIFFTFCIFGFYSYLSAVLLFYGSQINGLVVFWKP